jgi:hypothetical protein
MSPVPVWEKKLEDMNLLDFGHTLQLAGAIYAGEKDLFLMMLPSDPWEGRELHMLDLSQEDWKKVIRQTDLLETEILEAASDGKLTKAIIRKSVRQVEQGVSWTVYSRDHYHCRYCGAGEGVPLTVDHLVLWEDGGPTIEENLVTACRRCNRTRGRTPYGEWLESPYYKRVSQKLPPVIQEQNLELKYTLDDIPKRAHTRGR